MKHQCIVYLICLFVTVTTAQAFTPLEFLQHIQKQQQLPGNRHVQQNQPFQGAPLREITAASNAPQTEENVQPQKTKEIFRSFHGKAPCILKGCLSFAHESTHEKLPSFRICFKGKETKSDEEGFFSIPVDDEQLDQFTFIITKNIQQVFDKHNTVKGLKLLPNKNYLCYTYKRKHRHHDNEWVGYKTNLNKEQLHVPNDTIIVLLDPKYVDHLEEWNLTLAKNFIQLPHITLKKEIKNKSTDRAAAKSLLTSLDTAVFHEEIREVVKQPSEKVKITLQQ